MALSEAAFRLTLATLVAAAWAAEPPCAVKGEGYKGKQLTVNGGFLKDASACQEKCQASQTCSFFTFYTESEACWLLGPEAKIGPDVTGSISAPKVCPAGDQSSTAASESVSSTTTDVADSANWQQVTIAPGVSMTGGNIAPFHVNNESGTVSKVADAADPLGAKAVLPASIMARSFSDEALGASAPSQGSMNPGVAIGLAGLAGLAGAGIAYALTRRDPKKAKSTRGLRQGLEAGSHPRDVEATEAADPAVQAPLLSAIDFKPLATPATNSTAVFEAASKPSTMFTSATSYRPAMPMVTQPATPPSAMYAASALPPATTLVQPAMALPPVGTLQPMQVYQYR